jgi:hypothetical protein
MPGVITTTAAMAAKASSAWVDIRLATSYRHCHTMRLVQGFLDSCFTFASTDAITWMNLNV